MNKYTGDINVSAFLTYLKTNTTLKCVPMSDSKIEIIRNAFPSKEIPPSYISFLKETGDFFELWNGSDYILVNENKQFINLASHVQNDSELDSLFKKHGFSYNDCLFFWSHQGNSYLFFSLGCNNDSTVYILDANIESEKLFQTTFSEFLVDTYNSYVASHEILNNPWHKCRINMANRIIQDIIERFYEKDHISVHIPYEYDVYTVNSSDKYPHDFMTILNPVLKEAITTINSVYVRSDGTVYLYFPNKNRDYSNSIGFNLYGDKNFIIDREYTWGWIVQGNNIFVFGDKFRMLMKHIIPKLIIPVEGGKNEKS